MLFHCDDTVVVYVVSGSVINMWWISDMAKIFTDISHGYLTSRRARCNIHIYSHPSLYCVITVLFPFPVVLLIKNEDLLCCNKSA